MTSSNPMAFPVPYMTSYESGAEVRHGSDGMTLRDYFAAKAMAALIVANFYDMTEAGVSPKAYVFADAMLAARQEGRDE